jgi:hypothetical protein
MIQKQQTFYDKNAQDVGIIRSTRSLSNEQGDLLGAQEARGRKTLSKSNRNHPRESAICVSGLTDVPDLLENNAIRVQASIDIWPRRLSLLHWSQIRVPLPGAG